jgi:hypothetical protein
LQNCISLPTIDFFDNKGMDKWIGRLFKNFGFSGSFRLLISNIKYPI